MAKKEKKDTVIFSLRMPTELYKKVKTIAEKQRRTAHNLMSIFVEDGVSNSAKQQ